MPTGDPEQRHVTLRRHGFGDAHCRDTGAAGHAVPALLECVGDAHASIMPYGSPPETLLNAGTSSPRTTTGTPSSSTVQ